MMRLPVPTAREVRWTFVVAAVIALALTATLCWGIVHKINQSDVIVRIAASSADQVERLNDQLDAQAKASEAQRDELQRQNRLTRAQLRDLMDYLRAHGIAVPQPLTPTPSEVEPGSAVSHPKGSGPRGPRPTPTPSPASPATTAPPSPTASPGPVGSLCDLLGPICPRSG